ncbi:MAG: hypothetical protein LUC93_10485 [Planctomycetaceae bacterium]|nr:hypothetical protein [Planctomycetaceae bacterium]
MTMQTVGIIYFIVFVVFLIGIGYWASRKNDLQSSHADVDFFLAGKSTPVFVLGMSYCASAVSAGSFIGDPGLMSTIGWPYYWLALFLLPGLTIPGLYIIRRMRLQSERYKCVTVLEYVGARFKSPGLKLWLSILITFCYLFMLVAQFKGAAVLLEVYTGISFKVGLLIMSGLVLVYVNMGGLRSVAWADFFQGCLMCVLCLVLITISIYAVGGFSGREAQLADKHPGFLRLYETEPGATVPWYGIIGALLYAFFIQFAQPHTTQRYLAMPNVNRKSIGTFLLITLCAMTLFSTMYVVGLAGRVIYPDTPGDYMSVTMASTLLPPLISGVMMLGFFSAILSTAASILLIVGQSVGCDIYGHLAKHNTPQKEIRVSRYAMLVCIILVVSFNYVRTPSFLQLFIYLGMSGIGAGLCMPLMAGVMWKNASREGAIASSVLGPFGYILHVQILGQSWYWGMGAAVLWAVATFLVVTLVRNAIKGPDPELVELWNPLAQ